MSEDGADSPPATEVKRKARATPARAAVDQQSVVKLTLNQFLTVHDAQDKKKRLLPDSGIAAELELCVRGVTRVTVEASRLLNLWALMTFEAAVARAALPGQPPPEPEPEPEQPDLPEITQTTLEWAFKLFARVGNRSLPGEARKVFGAALDVYETLRPTSGSADAPPAPFDYSGVEQMIKYACRQYRTNCENHVALNLPARVGKAFRRFLSETMPAKFAAADRRRLQEYFLRRLAREDGVGPGMVAEIWATPRQEAAPLGAQEAVSKYIEDRVARYTGLPLDPRYPSAPREVVRPNWWKYLRWLYDLRQECGGGGEGGGRAFSLFPLVGFDHPQHVRVDSLVLHGLISRANKKKRKAVPAVPPDLARPPLVDRTAFSHAAAYYWPFYVNVKAVERGRRRKFQYSFSTDGYVVSALVGVPLGLGSGLGLGLSGEAVAGEEGEVAAAEPPPAKKCKKAVKKAGTAPGMTSEDLRGALVVGVDPGRVDLVSCVRYDGADGVDGVCGKIKDRSEEAQRARFSNREYQARIGLREAQRKRRRWYESAGLANGLLSLPSGKAASVAEMQAHISALLAVLDRTLEENFRRRVRSLRFEQYGRRQRVMHDICDRVLGLPTRKKKKNKGKRTRDDEATTTTATAAVVARRVVVAFGAGAFSSCSGGHAPGPVKAIRTALARRAGVCVVDVNEDYTSQLCHCCHERLDPLRGRIKVCKKNNNRTQDQGGEAPTRLGAVHGVRRCNSAKKGKECLRKTLDRDTNAALNMLYVFAHQVVQGHRPAVFTREAQTLARAAAVAPCPTANNTSLWRSSETLTPSNEEAGVGCASIQFTGADQSGESLN